MYRNKTRFTSCPLYLYNEKNARTMMVKKKQFRHYLPTRTTATHLKSLNIEQKQNIK